ncbi:MAG: 4-(cytidine 5'-diphospho)-2-C-methyl-D-erythritol kinase [Chloroflexota bacterium]|nr:4-(cytidine 5'-diphospho)-2-C-methyl-D-erythritol kinase [Chloroflexota bacterium]MDE2941854.1 4-(cytidine 5'-diphospho)-2-C-methyl-D-erythritol kinase [Chloroflexota bacterium]MDE3268326.1 4-(cytidine 5'-diphospho)-2-C-methyl-D-erythritol kinase [Chloroflexota bacterium]
MLTIRAYAKINLTLEVLGKRADGYHEVVTVMQTIDLCDELTLEPSADMSLRCSDPTLETEDNLVLRAADLLREHAGCDSGADIYLRKSIPVAAGLGGGSSDAAAALVGLRRLWGLEQAVSDLRPLAASLGSDVPFFLSGGTAIAEGRGDVITSLPALPRTHLVLLSPQVEIPNKTAAMYGRLTPELYTDGSRSARLRSGLESGASIDPDALFNVFESVAFGLHPAIEEGRRTMLDAGASWVRLSGSGPAMYAFTASAEEADAMARRLREAGHRAHAAATVVPSTSVAG